MPFSVRSAFGRLVPGLALAAALAGCASTSPYDALMQAKPSGSPFARALFTDYSYLARSFGIADAPSATSFDASASISVASLDSDVAAIADIFVDKALAAAKGEEPLPEPAPPDDQQTDALRMRLLRVLDRGRAETPLDAAWTQAEYDCWILDSTVESLATSAAQCHQAFTTDLTRLEHELNIKPPAPTQPTAPAQPAGPPKPGT